MKRYTALAVVVMCVVVMFGCHKIDHGTVVSKEVIPQRDWIWMMPITTCSGGKTVVCSTMFFPMFMHDPEQYAINVRGQDSAGAERVEKFYIPKGEWDTLQDGGFFACKKEAKCLRDKVSENRGEAKTPNP